MDDHTTRRRDELLDAIAWLRASILEDRQARAAILEHTNLAELVDDVTIICLDLLSECRDRDDLLRLLDNVRQRTEELAAGNPSGPQPDDDDPLG